MSPMTDNEAIHILKMVAQTQLRSNSGDLACHPALIPALRAAVGNEWQAQTSEGELARAALDLLSEDAKFAEAIQMMALNVGNAKQPQRYIEPTTITLATAVILALQTRIKIKVDQSGKWSVDIDKKSAGDSVTKMVLQRLLTFLER